MILNSPTISGSLTVTGNIITSGSITISGSIASASYATNADLLDGLDSTAFATTGAYSATSASLYATSASLSATSGSLSTASGSFNSRVTALEATGSALTSSLLTVSGSGYATSASLSTASGSFNSRVATIESKYATTGSNTFTSTQVVSGSILQSGSFTTTGTIIAQTINVQTVTSSVVYSSGSNVFGNSIGDSQRFTGSVLITGSLTIAGASSATSYSGATIYGSTVACSPIGCFATSCATSFIGGTMSGTTIYGSTAVCSANGLLIGNGGVTATCNYLPKFTGTSTIGNSNLINDASGNLGLGVTPSAMSAVSGIELLQGSQIASRILANVPQLYISSNVAGDSYAPTYKVNGYATQYRLQGYDGTHVFYTAPSGTAGNAITFSPALTIASTGAATFSSSVTSATQFIGNNTITDPTAATTTASVLALNGQSSVNNFGIGIGAIRNSAYDIWFQTGAVNGGGYRWYIGTSEKMTMSSGGNVGINCSAPSGKLQVANSSTQYALYTSTGNLELYTPEGNCGYVRLGSAYNLNGVYGGCGLNYLAAGTSNHVFYTTDGPTERMRITSTGIACFACQVCTPRIVAGEAILGNSYTCTFPVACVGGTYATVIPPNTLNNLTVYLAHIYYDNGTASPYTANTAFIFKTTNTNGGGVDNAYFPITSTHQGGTGCWSFRAIAGTGQVSSGLQIQAHSFANNISNATLYLVRLA